MNARRGPLPWRFLLAALAACLAPLLLAAAGPVTDTTSSPGAVVRGVDLGEARWTRGFWFERFENLRTNLLPDMVRLMEGTNVSQYLENFRIAAGRATGRPRGAPFNDGDYYKLLEAATAVLAVTDDAALSASVESAIGVIAQAQRDDGYLHTPVLARARLGDREAVPFRDRNNFELYNLGHLMTAACVHHRVTGRTNFLTVARRAADFLESTVNETSPDAARGSVCPSHFMGLVELWRATGDPRYLGLARRCFSLRSRIAESGDDNQDRIPFEQQEQAMGHAVRANYLYAGAADLYLETGDDAYRRPLGPIWTNLVYRKMSLTGGCGALYDGASPDGGRDQRGITRVHQAYGRNYQLPNTTAHNETCAAIGNVLWNWRMFLSTGEARFVDVVELALHNAVLSGVSLERPTYFYTNPLRVTDPMPVDLRWSRTRVPYVSAFCCPPNLLRTLAESATYAYARSKDAIWVNLYGSGTLRTDLDGSPVALGQETEFPWNGRIRIRFTEVAPRPVALRLRVPGWARTARASEGRWVRVNDLPENAEPDDRGYVEIRRPWKPGDTVDLDLPMPVQLLEAHPLVEETLNQVAVRRGPTVYCLESADLPPGTSVTDAAIPEDIDLIARYDRRLLGGCVVLEGRGWRRISRPWQDELYRPLSPPEARPVTVRFVPYSLWANRGPGEMSVWLARAGRGAPGE